MLAPDEAELEADLLPPQGTGLEQSAEFLRRILRSRPSDVAARHRLGVALRQLGRHDEAVAEHREVVKLVPCDADGHNNLGACLEDAGSLDEAAECYRNAARLRPNFYQALTNLGHVLMRMGDLSAAENSCRRALASCGNYAPAHSVLGTILAEQLRLDEAIACYRNAIALDSGSEPPHLNLGLALLQIGDFTNGWKECDWNRIRNATASSAGAWDGRESLRGKTILLRSEGGLGDVIHFARYVTLLAQRGARVIVECPSALVELMATINGISQVIVTGWPLPEYDLSNPFPSLPRLFNTTLGTVPATVPYLHAAPKLMERWRAPVGELPGFRVGVCWHGDQRIPNLRARSFEPSELKLLASIPGVTLVNLQHGVEPPSDLPLTTLAGLEPQRMRLTDVAAVMKHLDLVVTCDTSTAHLAGALAVPVWVALKYAACWRWLVDRSDSPWYPSMRLFRQEKRGEWKPLFERMAERLRREIPRGRELPISAR